MATDEQIQINDAIIAAFNEFAENITAATNTVFEPFTTWLTDFSAKMSGALFEAFGPMIERQRQRYEYLGMTSDEYHQWMMSLPDKERHYEIHVMCGAEPVDSPVNLLRPESE